MGKKYIPCDPGMPKRKKNKQTPSSLTEMTYSMMVLKRKT